MLFNVKYPELVTDIRESNRLVKVLTVAPDMADEFAMPEEQAGEAPNS